MGELPLEYNGHPMMVPMGSSLTAMKNGRGAVAKEPGPLQREDLGFGYGATDAKAIRQLTYKFLNIALSVGWRSPFSVSIAAVLRRPIFKFLGIPLSA